MAVTKIQTLKPLIGEIGCSINSSKMHSDRMEHGPKEATRCSGGRMSPRTFLAILFTVASCVFVAAYAYSLTFGASKDDTSCSFTSSIKDTSQKEADRALGSPAYPTDEEEHTGNSKGATPTVTTTGQRVAGHLLAVLLLASVAAAIVEAVRARLARSVPHKVTEANASGASSDTPQHHTSNHGGRTSRRGTLQEKSFSYDGHIYRSRSSSAGVSNQQVGAAASAAAAGVRGQKALRVRLSGKVGVVPPLLRRSSFPVMSRTPSFGGRDSSGGSPALGSRKLSINDSADEDAGEYQKRRVRLIRRF